MSARVSADEVLARFGYQLQSPRDLQSRTSNTSRLANSLHRQMLPVLRQQMHPGHSSALPDATFIQELNSPETRHFAQLHYRLNMDHQQLFIFITPGAAKLRYFFRRHVKIIGGMEEKFEEFQLDSFPAGYTMIDSPYRVRGRDGGTLFAQLATLSMLVTCEGYTRLPVSDPTLFGAGLIMLHRPEQSPDMLPATDPFLPLHPSNTVQFQEVLAYCEKLLNFPLDDFMNLNPIDWFRLLEEGVERFIAKKIGREPKRYRQVGMYEAGRYRVNLFPWSIFSWQLGRVPDGYIESITIYQRAPLPTEKSNVNNRHVVIIRSVNGDGSRTSYGLMPDSFEVGEIVKATHDAAVLGLYDGLWRLKGDRWFGSDGPRLSKVIGDWSRLFRHLGRLSNDKQEKALRLAKIDREAIATPCAYFVATVPSMIRFLDGSWLARGFQAPTKQAWWSPVGRWLS